MNTSFSIAKQFIPGGVNSPVRAFKSVGGEPVFIKCAEGAYLWDIDDKRYIDYVGSWGPMILGHAHPQIIATVKRVAENGLSFGAPTLIETELAAKICHLIPSVDKVRMVSSGTEATMHAIRISRAFTGRNKIIKFEGQYHGFHDAVLWSTFPPLESIGFRNSPVPAAQGSGIPQAYSQMTLLVPFNDEELLESKVKANWGDIACIIMEPVMGNCASIMPKDGYLEFVRKLCDQYGIVLIFDEVKTGFRIAKGGAQEYFGVTADLVTYAKALGNGFPIAAIGGKKEILGELGFQKIAHGGTYTGNVVATAAACATLDEIAAGALEKVNVHGEKLKAGFNKVLRERGIPGFVQGPAAMPAVVLTEEDRIYDFRQMAAVDLEIYQKIIWKLIEKAVMPDIGVHEPWFISASHTDSDADFTIGAFEEALKEVKV